MIKKIIYFAAFIIFLSCASDVLLSAENFIEVQATGRGKDRIEAMQNAFEEAIRSGTSTLIMAREELNNEALIDKVIQVSRANVRDAEIIAEKVVDGEVLLTVKFLIDKKPIDDALKNFRNFIFSNGSKLKVDVHNRDFFDYGYGLINSFFSGLDIPDFITIELDDIKIDTHKEQLSFIVRILFDRDKYYKKFSTPLTAILDNLISSPDYENLEKDYAAMIYILNEEKSFKAWRLPLSFWDAVKDGLKLENISDKKILRTQKRLWINIALIGPDGKELFIHRLPVHLPITNVLFFSMRNTPDPFAITNEQSEQLSKFNLICAPFLGIIENSGTSYQNVFYDKNDPIEQRFIFNLPREVLLKINNLAASLYLEK